MATSEEFKQLLEEQKKTNGLLAIANKDPSLSSSVKQNLGEIINASRLASQSEKFQEKEGITQTDDEQRKTTETIAKSAALQLEFANGNNFQLVRIQEGLAILGTQLNRMLKNMNINRVVNRLKEFSPDPKKMLTSAQAEEADEKNQKNVKNQIASLNTIAKNTKPSVLGKFFGDIFKRLGSDAVGVGKRLFQLAGLFGLYKILTDKNLMQVAETLDATVLPKLKTLYGILENVGKQIGGFIGKQLDVIGDPDSTSEEVAFAKGALLVSGLLALYSKSIGTFVVKKTFTGLLALSKLTPLKFFGPIGLAAAALLGAYFVKDEAIKRAKELIDEEGQGGPMQKARVYTASFLGEMLNGTNDFLAGLVGIFNEEKAEKMRKVDFVPIVNDGIKSFMQIFKDMFSDFMQIFKGSTRKDVQYDIDKYSKQVDTIEKRLADVYERAEKSGMNVKRDPTFRPLVNSLTDAYRQLDKAEQKMKELDATGKEKIGGLQIKVAPGMIRGMNRGGIVPSGNLALIGEGPGGRGGELVYSGSDAMVLNQSRTDALLTMALQKGLSGGGGNEAPVVVSTDNSVRSNTSNMMASAPIVTSNDTFTNAIASSV